MIGEIMDNAADKRILVVDDEPDIREFLSTCLEDAGFQVEVAFDGVDALDKVEKSIPDLITLDMVMPRKSGLAFMRQLRKKEEWKEIPVIVITAHSHDEFASEDVRNVLLNFELKQRPRRIMEKPVAPAELIKVVTDILSVNTTTPHAIERSELINLINSCDPEQLKKIKNLIK
jgi:two-component system, OmpR family, alkaline phosphatase synthesis response regulator PhoP